MSHRTFGEIVDARSPPVRQPEGKTDQPWLAIASCTTRQRVCKRVEHGEFASAAEPAIPSRVAFWLLLYSTFAILAAYMFGAVWGAGNETMPMAAGAADGSAVQENVIRAVAYSSAPTDIIAFALILCGLRMANPRG